MQPESVATAERSYIVLRLEPEGGYTVTCPALPGLVTDGESLDEARAMAEDAVRGYLDCLRERGEPIPDGDADTGLVERMTVTTDADGLKRPLPGKSRSRS